ncbi:Uncharacterised protein [Candidatus Gugararchaeum adminiculabundum]|nr:Uncharacterised protein [Candidatus Gugararchaeum adminiculabundum]
MGAENSEHKAVGVTKYLVSLPKTRYSIALILLAGVAISLVNWAIEYNAGILKNTSFLEQAAMDLLVISVPAILSALTVGLVKKDFLFKRLMFLSFVGACIYGIAYVIAKNAPLFLSVDPGLGSNLIFIAFGVTFALYYLIARIVFGLKFSSIVFASVQLAYNAGFLFATQSAFISSESPVAVLFKLYMAALVFIGATYLVFFMIDAPMKRNFGVKTTDVMTRFLAQWLRDSNELEEMFEEVGQEVETLVGTIAFKNTGGANAGKTKALFVFPYVHYGPFGSLGGSDFPNIISQRLDKEKKTSTFVFHATATHDFNPVNSEEVEKILGAVDASLAAMKLEGTGGGLVIGKAGAGCAKCIKLADKMLVLLTRAPYSTEDISFSSGLALRSHAMGFGYSNAIIADCHNSEVGDYVHVLDGDPIIFEYFDAISNVLGKKVEDDGEISLGIFLDGLQEFGPNAGVAGAGMRIAFFKFGDGARKSIALVLIDANGVLPAFRRDVIDRVKEKLGVECEILTTDAHSINKISEIVNPIGKSRKDEILERIIAGIGKAQADTEKVRFGMDVKRVKIDVFGPKNSYELVSTVNSILAIGKIVVPLVLAGALIFALLLVTRLKL